jgi:hypothetical protein
MSLNNVAGLKGLKSYISDSPSHVLYSKFQSNYYAPSKLSLCVCVWEILTKLNTKIDLTIKGQLPFLNKDSAFVRSFCALSPCIETAFQPLETSGQKSSVASHFIFSSLEP